jgi:citrate synthase
MARRRLLTTSEVAHRLGVKRETVYAYVSRGLIERHPSSGHRRSLFDRDAVEDLAGHARHRDRSNALEVVIETELTLLDPDGRLFYRGHDAVQLARFSSFERVAELLWGGPSGGAWELDREMAEIVGKLRDAVPGGTAAPDRIPLTISALGASDPRRADRRPEAVRRTAAQILAGALDGLAPPAAPADRSAAARLWAALSAQPRSPRPAQLAALNASLVLLADHELAASTLAARVAASAWADPYRVVLAGLGPLGGVLHGGASLAVEAMFAGLPSADHAFQTLESQVAAAGVAAGFGHRVYRDRDPRADHLLGRVAAVAVDGQSARNVAAILDAAAALDLPAPNVDLGIAALSYAMGLRAGAATTIFTVARLAGLLAHAIEEYRYRLRFRPRASYRGPSPRP